MATVQRKRMTVRGVGSPYLEAGVGREGAVFLHGNPGSGEDWRALVEAAGEFMAAVAPDMPGFGKADKPADFDYTIDGYARHLDAMIEHLGLARVHLVLHDFGGPWGLTWAALHPQKVASITLINTGVLPGYRWHYLARIWRTPLLGEVFMAITTRMAWRWLLKLGNPRGLPLAFVDQMFDNFDAGTRRAVLKLYRATGDIEGYTARITQALQPLDLPALVVWGAGDIYLPTWLAAAQRRAFPGAEIEMLLDSGHFPLVDNPERVVDVVGTFLRKQLEI